MMLLTMLVLVPLRLIYHLSAVDGWLPVKWCGWCGWSGQLQRARPGLAARGAGPYVHVLLGVSLGCQQEGWFFSLVLVLSLLM